MTKLRLAIVGAGPAGIYAADILLKAEKQFDVSIDLFEQLPAPYGLVRYGVAPDHPRIKGIITALREVLDSGKIRLFGNVYYGRDITLDDLKKHYNAVIFSTGSIKDADLKIPGIDLDGSYGAADFVSWYDGHPDVSREWPLTATSTAVIGNGNVALDVARILVKHADDLLPTEIPANVYDGLKTSPITDVHVFGRRGPMQVKFTPLELRELGELRDVDMVVAEEDFNYDEAALNAIATNKQIMVLDRIFKKWRAEETGTASRRLHLHFFAKPLEIVAGDDGKVALFRYERTEPDGEGGVRGTGEIREVELQSVYRAVGYFGSPLDGIPFDEKRGVIPNREGQVLDDEDQQVHGVYATGWIKRGPVGLIGHTKSDAMETVKHVINDQPNWWTPAHPEESAVTELLASRGVEFTNLDGWHSLDEHEKSLGEPEG
ncbi:MAG: pyridine nucleotide-disulfide oxidoreductase, partial [Glaciihabitans sp.]|nr:pyridine nucleotide-disulfide oxidoreductase [Glaciihabitans sp.]